MNGAGLDDKRGWRVTELKRELSSRLVSAAVYLFVSTGFYVLSLILPGLFAGIKIPGLPSPLSDLEWLLWASLFVSYLLFATTAIYEVFKAVDPLFEVLARRIHGDVKPVRRIARDLALILLVVLLVTAINPLTTLAGSAAIALRVVVGLATFIVLIVLLYDISRTIYQYVKNYVEILINKFFPT
ncbi:MAG: hypothetical protein QXY49_02865 [Thermofilaceae archaeon]